MGPQILQLHALPDSDRHQPQMARRWLKTGCSWSVGDVARLRASRNRHPDRELDEIANVLTRTARIELNVLSDCQNHVAQWPQDSPVFGHWSPLSHPWREAYPRYLAAGAQRSGNQVLAAAAREVAQPSLSLFEVEAVRGCGLAPAPHQGQPQRPCHRLRDSHFLCRLLLVPGWTTRLPTPYVRLQSCTLPVMKLLEPLG